MSKVAKKITEGVIRTDLNTLYHTLAAELAMACKKMAIYSGDHPIGRKSLERPFLIFAQIFSFRKEITITVQRGALYICNVRLKDAVYYEPILQAMQILDITTILFYDQLSIRDFSIFLQRFVKRMRPDDPEYQLSEYLKKSRIATIEVNSEKAFGIFEKQRQYRGEIDDDFSVRRFVLDQMGNDLSFLAKLNDLPDDAMLDAGIDFDPGIVRYLLPEKVSSLKPKLIRSELETLAHKIRGASESDPDRSTDVHTYMSVFKLVGFHPDKQKILENLDAEPLAIPSKQEDIIGPAHSSTGAIKINVINQVDGILEDLFNPSNQNYNAVEFSDSFSRLLKTGLRGKAEDTMRQLMGYLRDPNPAYRQKALNLIINAFGQFNPETDSALLETIVSDVTKHLAEHKETFEYSELISKLCDRCLVERRYNLMADITVAMAARRHFDADVVIYDSMAVKKSFETLNRREIIDRLVDDMIKADHDTANAIKLVLISIGTEEVALALSQIVAHPIRQVRQQSLRILAELGKAALKVFSRIVCDDSWFQRETDRHELPDAKWYVVRNSIFVLGSLRDPAAVFTLRLRMSDNDIRVRREIVTALEKIKGEEAVDLLIMMAEDHAKEIRESSVSAIGSIGAHDIVPLLIDIIQRNTSDTLRLILIIGKLGGDDARNFLGRIFEDENELTNLSAGKVSKDDLRLTIVKALGAIGDKTAIDKIKNYQANLPAAQKLLFKNSPVNKAISEILARH